MAQGKKSFIAYSDWKETFDNLSDEYAGMLIKHIFAYVNDDNPVSEEMIINAVFPNIKNSLKRDLDKWDSQIEQRRNAGKKSAEVRATKSNERSIPLNETERNPTDSVSVSVTVSDSDILLEKVTKEKFNFIKSLSDFGFDKNLISDWLLVRKNKKLSNTETVFKKICSDTLKAEFELNMTKDEILEYHVSKSWGGFNPDWIKKELAENNKNLKDEPKVGRMPVSVAIKNATGWGDIEI